MQEAVASELEADLARLQVSIRQLKIQYDMFFAGSIPKQPTELRAEVEKLIKRYANVSIRKYAHRFHLNSLVARYNALSELWGKTLRNLEEGERRVPALVDHAPEERTIASALVTDAARDHESLRLLHAKFVEARKKSGEDAPDLPFDRFLRGIVAKTGKLRDESGCDKIELRLVVRDRKVQLKARSGR